MNEKPLHAYKGQDPYVFVSYAHDDDERVYPEIRWLQDQGFNVWYDEGVKAGLEWRAELSESIKQAHVVICFITPRSVRSDHCLREIDLAVDLKKPLLAVYLEPTQLPSGTDLTLSRIQGLLRYELTEATYQKALVKHVGEHIERGVAQVASDRRRMRKGWKPALYVGAATLLLAGVASRLLLSEEAPDTAAPPSSGALTKFAIEVPEHYLPPFGQPDIAVSRDGNSVVYNAGGMLNIRRMDEFDSEPLPGTRDAHGPFFSPDDRWIGFTQDQTLRRYSVKTGVITEIAPRIGASFSGYWGEDDSIVYAPIGNIGISRVAASGGAPELITGLDQSSRESTHMWPQLLDNDRVMYTALGPSAGWEEAQIVVENLRSGERKTLVKNASQGAYVPPGYIAYVNGDGNLMVAPFDPVRLALSGPAVPLQSGIFRSIWGAGASYAASRGTLAFVQGDAFKGMQIERIQRNGDVAWFGEPTYGNYMRISPDDTRMALTIRGVNNDDIFTFDLTTGERQRLTFELAEDEAPVWSADGSQIAYVSTWKGDSRRVFAKPADGSGEPELLHADPRHLHTSDWSADGRWFLFEKMPLYDVFAINIETGEELPLAVSSSALENDPQFSPDGRWVAFASNESGQAEIYVISFPDASVKHQVSRNGGISPRWVQNNELFYWSGPDLIAAQVSTSSGFEIRHREVVHTDPAMARTSMTSIPGYDVTSDGQEIYVIKEHTESAPTQIQVIRGWQSELGTARI